VTAGKDRRLQEIVLDRYEHLVYLLRGIEEEQLAEMQRQADRYAQMNKWQRFKHRVGQLWPCRLWKILTGSVSDTEIQHARIHQELMQMNLRQVANQTWLHARYFFGEAKFLARYVAVCCKALECLTK